MKSRFTTSTPDNHNEILNGILSILSSELTRQNYKFNLEEIDNPAGFSEFQLKNSMNQIFATASISDFYNGLYYWSVYKEN